MNTFKYVSIILLAFLFSNHTFSFEKQRWHVNNNQHIEVAFTKASENAKGTILFLHGGPDLGTFDTALAPQSSFFTDLSNFGFNVVAPHLAYDSIRPRKNNFIANYWNIINRLALHIINDLKTPLILMSHSYGGHFAGRTLALNGALEENIHKWIVLSGTTHHGAGELRRVGYKINDLYSDLDDIEPNDLLNVQENFLKINMLYNLKTRPSVLLSDQINRDAKERFSLENIYAEEINEFNNPLINQEMNKNFSVEHLISKIKGRFPILIVHPINDSAVTIDVGLSFYEKLIDAEFNNAHLITNNESPHNWMKEQMKEDDLDSYNYFLSSIKEFLSENYETVQANTQTSLEKISEYLENYPQANFVDLYEQFHENNPVEFYSFENDGFDLAAKHFKPENLKESEGIENTREQIRFLLNRPDNLFGSQSVNELEELRNEAQEKKEQTSGRDKAYLQRLINLVEKYIPQQSISIDNESLQQ